LDSPDKVASGESSSEWPRPSSSSRLRVTERRRHRRRSRRPNNVRAKIRVRMWVACTGALFLMAVVLYLALGRERPEGGEAPSASLAAVPSALVG
jgi:hypothetical protein